MRRPAATIVSKTPQVLGFKKAKPSKVADEEPHLPERQRSAARDPPQRLTQSVHQIKKKQAAATPTAAQQ